MFVSAAPLVAGRPQKEGLVMTCICEAVCIAALKVRLAPGGGFAARFRR